MVCLFGKESLGFDPCASDWAKFNDGLSSFTIGPFNARATLSSPTEVALVWSDGLLFIARLKRAWSKVYGNWEGKATEVASTGEGIWTEGNGVGCSASVNSDSSCLNSEESDS